MRNDPTFNNCEISEKEPLLKYIEERFDISRNLLVDHSFYLTQQGKVFTGPKYVPPLKRIVSIGILSFRADGAIKPSTNLLQIIGKYAKKNLISLDHNKAHEYLKGSDLRFSKEELQNTILSDGYVIVFYEGIALGCGLLKGQDLKNVLPKAKRLDVKHW